MNTTTKQYERDHTVIVTGAGGGLGRATVLRLLRDGFRCVLADRDKATLKETVSLAGLHSGRATIVECDLREREQRDRLVAIAAQQQDHLFGLINCAGVAVADALLDENVPEWRLTMEINLEAAYFLCQSVIEHMRETGEGRIVNIASVYGFMALNNVGYGDRAPETTPGNRGPVRQSAYAASKGGLIQLTRDLAAAVGRWNITVNAVSPGTIPHSRNQDDSSASTSERDAADPAQPTKPRLGDKVDPRILESLAKQIPLQRVGRAEEIAGPVSFLLSSDATYITGANIVVDGGWSIW